MRNITLTKIEEVYTVHSPKGRSFQMHERHCYGLSFCIGGQITYRQNGTEFISDPDHAVLLPKGQSYTLYGDRTGSFPVIDFQCADFESDTFLVLPIPNKEAILSRFEQLKKCALLPSERPKAMALFYEILAILTEPAKKKHSILDAALSYLEEHLTDPKLSNADPADAAGISEVHFRKLFLKEYGTTPKQYILNLRLEMAKQLLQGTLSVTAIAEQCGFSGVYHFCRIFKEKTGSTPSEYRRQNRIIGI